MDVSIATSENNYAVTSGDERKREKDRDNKDKDRRERRDRDKDRGKDRDKDRERKRSRRSRSRDRRDKDKYVALSFLFLFCLFSLDLFCSFEIIYSLCNRERESRRDYPREDGVEQIRVKEEPPDGKYLDLYKLPHKLLFCCG